MESENIDQTIAELKKEIAELKKEIAEGEKGLLTKMKRIADLKNKHICHVLSGFPALGLLNYYLELKDFKDKSVRMIGVDKRFLCGVTCGENCPAFNLESNPLPCEVMSAAIRAFQAQEDYWKHKIELEEKRI